MKSPTLRKLSFDELLALRTEIDVLLADRIDGEKRALEAKIAKLNQLPDAKSSAFQPSISEPMRAKGTKVPPRFYNPDDPSEKWSGRGLRPRWMVAALAAGHSLEDMVLDEDTGLPPATRTKKNPPTRRT